MEVAGWIAVIWRAHCKYDCQITARSAGQRADRADPEAAWSIPRRYYLQLMNRTVQTVKRPLTGEPSSSSFECRVCSDHLVPSWRVNGRTAALTYCCHLAVYVCFPLCSPVNPLKRCSRCLQRKSFPEPTLRSTDSDTAQGMYRLTFCHTRIQVCVPVDRLCYWKDLPRSLRNSQSAFLRRPLHRHH